MIDSLVKEIRDVKLEVNSLFSKKKSYKCLHPECDETSILSHSISKKNLHKIMRDGHVIVPQFDRARFSEEDLDGKSINLSFKEVGVDRASTFKGFCQKHDSSIFKNIDNRGIKTNRDVFLQLYRTARMFSFTSLAHSKAELKVLGYEYNCNSEFDESLPISLEKIIDLCEDLLVDFPDLDSPIEINSKETLSIKPFSKKVQLDVEILYKRIGTIFPVALQKCFTLHFEGNYFNSLVIITPDENFTNIIILSPPSVVPQYSSCLNSDINILNFIESVLMHDSDFYLCRDVINSFSHKKLEAITSDFYFFDERSFLERYDISIFDEIRKKICLTLDENERVVELGKIYEIPNRDPVETRNNRQALGAIKDRHKKLLHSGNTSNVCYPIGSLRVL